MGMGERLSFRRLEMSPVKQDTARRSTVCLHPGNEAGSPAHGINHRCPERTEPWQMTKSIRSGVPRIAVAASPKTAVNVCGGTILHHPLICATVNGWMPWSAREARHH
jgi:hypothetical protein